MNARSFEDLRTLEALDAFQDEHEAPTVLPVNYIVVDDAVLFRTEPALAARLRDRPITFQVDRVDTYRRVGWSVLVRGCADVVERSEADLATWAPGDRTALVRVTPAEITGRRLETVIAPSDERGYL
jgi:hypothetical protein